MKTESKVLASFIAAAIWADGEYNEFEKEFIAELGDGLGIKDFEKVLESEIAAVESMSEDDLADYLEKNAKAVNAKEKEGVLAICLQALCADAFLSQDEIENFFAFADILGVDEEAAQDILDEFIDEEEDLIIEED
jgi:uncharacterized tellurite resistance protein B-like protein